MDVREQGRLSGLVLDNDPEEPASWNRNDHDWPPLDRYGHASVVVHPPNNNKEESVVVVGGCKWLELANNSVFLANAAQQSNCRQWIEGPAMNEARSFHAAVVCNDGLYAIGGRNDSHSDQNTIERIDIIDLLSPKKLDKESQWKPLTCRLSKARWDCSAAAIHNRYIVVVGGRETGKRALTSVEIIDTEHESQPYIFPGPPLNVPRRDFGMTVIGLCIYVVGGTSNNLEKGQGLKSVECLKMSDSRGEGTNNKGTSVFPPSLSWTIHEKLALNQPRYGHAVARVGSCLVVSGGCPLRSQTRLQSVEVMDTKRNKVWRMVPKMTVAREGHTMVSISTGIICISGLGENSCERLSLMDKNSAVFMRLLFSARPCKKDM